MKEFDEILNVWKEQKETNLDVNKVLMNINKSRNKMAFKLLLGILAMFLSLVVMVLVWYYIDFQKLSTYIGLSIIIFFVFVYTLLMLRQSLKLRNQNKLLDPIQSLEQLKDIKKEQLKMSTLYINIYFVALVVGMLLYFIEVLQDASIMFKVTAYVLTFGWLCYGQFVITKKQRIKTNAKIDSMIESLENIQNQLK